MRVAPIALIVALLACGKTRRDPPPPFVFYSLEEGEAAARRSHKLALVFFGAEWSTADKELEHYTFPDPEVREALRDWIAIKVDMTDDEEPGVNQKKDRFKVIGDPTTILIDFGDPVDVEFLRFNEFVKPITMASAIRATAKERSRREEVR